MNFNKNNGAIIKSDRLLVERFVEAALMRDSRDLSIGLYDCLAILPKRDGLIMAAPRRVIELAYEESGIVDLTSIARSHSESALIWRSARV